MKVLKRVILPLIFLAVLAYVLMPPSCVKLRDTLWYQYKITSSMKTRIPMVQELMTNSLKRKYNQEFVVEKPGIWGDLLGCWYQARAYPVANPIIKFNIHTDLFSFGNGNFSEEKLLAIFYDNYPLEVMDHREKELEALFQKFYPPGDFTIGCRFIKGSDEAFKRLKFNKELVVDFRTATATNDMALQGSIYIDKFVASDEAERLSHIFSNYLAPSRIDKYIITVSFFEKSKRADIEKERRQNRVPQNIADEEGYYVLKKRHFDQGYLLNACILFGFKKSNKIIPKKQIIDSFIFK